MKNFPDMFKGLSSKIYFAFLIAAGVPVLIAGAVGIYFSLETLRRETLHHLEQEVHGRAASMGYFFDQLSSELLYLASSSRLYDLANSATATGGKIPVEGRKQLEGDYAAFARAYPYIYQVRYLDAKGKEIVRVDRHDERLIVVPETELQDKSDRYYVREGLKLEAGQVYISPLDLNVERGQVEKPERPVIRFATPVIDRKGNKQGLLIVNLHAAFILGQIGEMAGSRGGVAYLFDRSGSYLSRTSQPGDKQTFTMQPVESLTDFLPGTLLKNVVSGNEGSELLGDWIFAYAPIKIGATAPNRGEWSVALSFPREYLFKAIFNLYLLYGMLTLSLLMAAAAGFLLSRHLLRPLILLGEETEEIAQGHFSHRVEIRGDDEIADLGRRFNTMAARLDELVRSLAAHRDRLEEEVRARTRELEDQQENRRLLDRQAFQMEKMATLGEVAMGLAHEIGNPLTGIKAVVQLMLEDHLEPFQREYLLRVQGEINRLADFLRTFHGFAAPQEMNRVPCRLEQILEDVLLWTRKEARMHGISIEYVPCCDAVPELWADPAQIKQVLLNLVINAIHALPDGGSITIGMCAGWTEDDNPGTPRMRFCVCDTGIGIPEELQARIFDPFFTTRHDGSGIGLAVVKKIVQQHDADIYVKSAPGHGTCFSLVWPIAPGAVATISRAQNYPYCRKGENG